MASAPGRTRKETAVFSIGCAGPSGFTLIELIVVVLVLGAAMALVGLRLGTFNFWREEAFIRKISETITFLHHQAVVDQAFYRMEFDLEKNNYSVAVLRPDDDYNLQLIQLAENAGNLSLELAALLSPSIGTTQTLIPPPSMPSLAEPVPLPSGTYFEDIRTMRGKISYKEGGTAYILFSPRGFSEFAVIHLRMGPQTPLTILVNPFTGLTEIYRSYKDFEWTYGKKNRYEEDGA